MRNEKEYINYNKTEHSRTKLRNKNGGTIKFKYPNFQIVIF